MTWVDTHCHLDDDRYRAADGAPEHRELGGTLGVLANARAAGVGAFITVGCDRASSIAAIDCASAHDDVWATVGLHPHEAAHGVSSIDDLLRDRGTDSRVIAVGEAGLDYYYDHSPRDAQREAFADQIQLAHELDLPLIIHTRDAWDDTFDVLAAERVPSRIVFHCFTGGPDEARRCLDIGAHLSFSGIVTFKTAADVAEAARMCPTDRMLVETDSPYLAPVPHRGRTNQPAHVVDVGRHIASLLGRDAAEVAEFTTANAFHVFPALRPRP